MSQEEGKRPREEDDEEVAVQGSKRARLGEDEEEPITGPLKKARLTLEEIESIRDKLKSSLSRNWKEALSLAQTLPAEELYRFCHALKGVWFGDAEQNFSSDFRLRMYLNLFGLRTEVEGTEDGALRFGLDKWHTLPQVHQVELAAAEWINVTDNLMLTLTHRPADEYRARAMESACKAQAKVQAACHFVKVCLLMRRMDDPGYSVPSLSNLELEQVTGKYSSVPDIRRNILRFAKAWNLRLSEMSPQGLVLQEIVSQTGHKTRAFRPVKVAKDMVSLRRLFSGMTSNPNDPLDSSKFFPEEQRGTLDTDRRSAILLGQGLTEDRTGFARPKTFHQKNTWIKLTLVDMVTALVDAGPNQPLYNLCPVSPGLVMNHMTMHSELFPVHSPCRNVNSYDTGIYDARNNRFYPYSSPLPREISSCKYHRCVFKPEWVTCPIDEIQLKPDQTPVFHQILRDQDLNDKQIADVEAMFGRAMLPQGMDSYQMVLTFIGRPATGKSVILTIFRMLFPNEFVGVLSGDEVTFGLSVLTSKWIFICNELSKNMERIAHKLLALFSHDYDSHARKNKEAIAGKVDSNGIMSGNTYFDFDNGNNMTRRIFPVYFLNKPRCINLNLVKQAAQELGAIQARCMRRYFELRNGIPNNVELMNYVDPMFKENRMKTGASLNPYNAFLAKSTVVFADHDRLTARLAYIDQAYEDKKIDEAEKHRLERDAFLARPYMSMDTFFELFGQFVKSETNMKAPGKDEIHYMPILQDWSMFVMDNPPNGLPWLEPSDNQDLKTLGPKDRYPVRELCKESTLTPKNKLHGKILVGLGINNWEHAYLMNPAMGAPGAKAKMLGTIRYGADLSGPVSLYLPESLTFPKLPAFQALERAGSQG